LRRGMRGAPGKDEFRRRVCPVWRIAALCGVLFGHREE
jgi:hypothetical protein